MLNGMAGEIAGKIWEALNEKGELTTKQLKKAIRQKTEKDLYLGLGWLLREDKINTTVVDKEVVVSLK